MRVLTVIGDLVQSRDAEDRRALQRAFKRQVNLLNRGQASLISPYTVTLGDEFQAVLSDAQAALADTIAIQAGMYPERMRFSLAVGEITTDLNRESAIGMDGPAFYLAREGMEQLKKSGKTYHVSGLPDGIGDFINCSLRIADVGMQKWKKNRFDIMRSLDLGLNAQQIGEQLGISDKAVYKNIQDSGMEDISLLFRYIGEQVQKQLEAA